MTASSERPIGVLIAAMGGEGGGVLADWLLEAAHSAGHRAQSTSIPGVSQRTGATTYYFEMASRASPVAMTLAPTPGNVDVVVASELLEAARPMLAGFVTPDRTTLVASTHRIYTIHEKTGMGDERYDAPRILEAAQRLARQRVLFDMRTCAQQAGSIVNAVMFGALAAASVLPLTRAQCEAAIRAKGTGVNASLAGFAAGFEYGSREGAAQRVAALGMQLVDVIDEGKRRTADYQDSAYAALYAERVERVRALDASAHLATTRETARFLALWMCYEDMPRVADLKSRPERLARVRDDVRAQPQEPVRVVEYFKPGVEEVAASLPKGLARRLLAWSERRGLTHRLNVGLYIDTTRVWGYACLRMVAALRVMRRRTARFAEEQAAIDGWLERIVRWARDDPQSALEVALAARMVKGYGDTRRRAMRNFDALMELADRLGPSERADALARARVAALADPKGSALDALLAERKVPRVPMTYPLRFHKPRAARP